jgi:hypothetical protein
MEMDVEMWHPNLHRSPAHKADRMHIYMRTKSDISAALIIPVSEKDNKTGDISGSQGDEYEYDCQPSVSSQICRI